MQPVLVDKSNTGLTSDVKRCDTRGSNVRPCSTIGSRTNITEGNCCSPVAVPSLRSAYLQSKDEIVLRLRRWTYSSATSRATPFRTTRLVNQRQMVPDVLSHRCTQIPARSLSPYNPISPSSRPTQMTLHFAQYTSTSISTAQAHRCFLCDRYHCVDLAHMSNTPTATPKKDTAQFRPIHYDISRSSSRREQCCQLRSTQCYPIHRQADTNASIISRSMALLMLLPSTPSSYAQDKS